MTKKQWFAKGAKAGVPIAAGYFAVSIALGIAAKMAGVSPFAAALSSLLINASAGEYVGFSLIAAGATYIEMLIMEAVANARYLLMSTALSQRLEPKTTFLQRLLLGFTITDEIFGASISLEGYVSPYFTYGAFVVATCGWTSGTLLGAILGEILPTFIVNALSIPIKLMQLSWNLSSLSMAPFSIKEVSVCRYVRTEDIWGQATSLKVLNFGFWKT